MLLFSLFFLINDNRTVAFAVTNASLLFSSSSSSLFSREDLRILSKYKTFPFARTLSLSIRLGRLKIYLFPTRANGWIDLPECARVCNNNTSRWCHFLHALDMPTIVVNPIKMVNRKIEILCMSIPSLEMRCDRPLVMGTLEKKLSV